MYIDRKQFYKNYRDTFYKRISQKQVNCYETCFDYWEAYYMGRPIEQLAYILATAFHETGGKMEPVREGFAKTNEGAIRAVTRLYQKGIISRNYALPEPNGNSYYGRGLVQITWPRNYKKLGEALGIGDDLYNQPDLALDIDVSVQILFIGMMDGLFSGKSLPTYINDEKIDYINARRVVNGRDRAKLIAGHAENFYYCLTENVSGEVIDLYTKNVDEDSHDSD